MSKIPVDSVQDVFGRVEADTPCRKCSYNIRGLSLDGQCPECATPIRLSVSDDLLRYSPPEFIRKLRKGVTFMLWGVLAMIVVGIVAAAVGSYRPPAAHLLGLLAVLPTIIGNWLLATPDPGGVGEERYGTERKIVRVSLAIVLLGNLITFIVSFAEPLGLNALELVRMFGFMVAVVGVVGATQSTRLCKKIRGADSRSNLVQAPKILTWGLGITASVVIVILLVSEAGGWSFPVWFDSGFGFASIMLWIFVVMYISMLFRLRWQFTEQAAFAQAMWSDTQC